MTTTTDKIHEWIKLNYKGGLIRISDLSAIADSQLLLYGSLYGMEKDGEIKIIDRYFCPNDFHSLGESPENGYCRECDYSYPINQLDKETYIKPLRPVTAVKPRPELKPGNKFWFNNGHDRLTTHWIVDSITKDDRFPNEKDPSHVWEITYHMDRLNDRQHKYYADMSVTAIVIID